MDLNKLKALWKSEEEHSFKGWDFSYINNRVKDEPLPWDYKETVKSYISDSKKILDMGTGGGEFLLSLNTVGGNTYATESYLPNVEVARKNLEKKGIQVVYVEDVKNLPFENETFDLIINRHEDYNIEEINRVLKSNGVFITQQVGGLNNREMSKYLLGGDFSLTNVSLDLNHIESEAIKNNMTIIEKAEAFPKSYFYDIGALVFLAKIIEWEFPNFSVDKCFDKLVELQKQLEEKGHVETTEHRYFLVASKK